ncbi:hypothetical protein PN836_012940 [Ningiella sp. W23]|uniref:hypothetical protein n=1 Tax=Ningiella sp. W23 TaxID=3023715 RepID=UPI0037575DE6
MNSKPFFGEASKASSHQVAGEAIKRACHDIKGAISTASGFAKLLQSEFDERHGANASVQSHLSIVLQEQQNAIKQLRGLSRYADAISNVVCKRVLTNAIEVFNGAFETYQASQPNLTFSVKTLNFGDSNLASEQATHFNMPIAYQDLLRVANELFSNSVLHSTKDSSPSCALEIDAKPDIVNPSFVELRFISFPANIGNLLKIKRREDLSISSESVTVHETKLQSLRLLFKQAVVESSSNQDSIGIGLAIVDYILGVYAGELKFDVQRHEEDYAFIVSMTLPMSVPSNIAPATM